MSDCTWKTQHEQEAHRSVQELPQPSISQEGDEEQKVDGKRISPPLTQTHSKSRHEQEMQDMSDLGKYVS